MARVPSLNGAAVWRRIEAGKLYGKFAVKQF
jgi:hypothetical protein